jgi:hypothetical protein
MKPRVMARLKHTRVKLKNRVLPTNRTSDLDGVRPPSVLSTLFQGSDSACFQRYSQTSRLFFS